jgi:hypothetical protein
MVCVVASEVVQRQLGIPLQSQNVTNGIYHDLSL